MIRRLPLRLLLTLPYVALLLSLAAVVGWLSYRSADVAIDDMAAKLHAASGERIQEATAAYLTNWQYVVAAATAPEPSAGAVTLPPIERALWVASGLSSVRPSYVYFSAPDGRFIGVQRQAQGPALLKLREQGGSEPRRLFNLQQPADRTKPLGAEKESYVALQRPWYATAVASPGEVWSPVYLDFSTQLPMITLTLAQRNEAGELLGVYGADVPLAQIETFMRSLEIAKQGLAYIVNSDGRIVASSLPANGAVAHQELPRAMASADTLLVASFEAIDHGAVNSNSAAGRPALIDTPQGRMLVSVSPLRHQAGLDWRVVVVLKQDVLTAGINRNAVRTALLASAAALAALVLGTLILRSLAGEIGALTRAAEQLSAEQAPEPLSTRRRDELGRLSNAFDRMVARLATSTQVIRLRNQDLSRTLDELKAQQAAREEAESSLRRVADAMAEGFVVVDPQWRITFANQVTMSYTGQPVANLEGQNLWQALPQLAGTELETALRAAAASGKPAVIETWREQRSAWIEARLLPSPSGMAVFFSNVTQRRQARDALAERQRELQRLAGELLTAQSEERRTIARELHDELGQQLAALRINLQVLAANCNDEALHRRLDDSLAIVQQTIEQVRSRALDLHPAILDDLGLVAALQWLCERQSQRSGVPIRLIDGPTLPAVPPTVALACFRIAQEAIANALHHGQPPNIDVQLSVEDGTLELLVVDNGSGFVPLDGAHTSLGLVGMRERAQQLGGELILQSQHNQGTRVRVRIPVSVPLGRSEGTERPEGWRTK
jgi:signal transduction histidine kinase